MREQNGDLLEFWSTGAYIGIIQMGGTLVQARPDAGYRARQGGCASTP
jgi:hypothetical protein